MGLYKLCEHKGRNGDRCEHPWWGSFRGVRVSLTKWANRDIRSKARPAPGSVLAAQGDRSPGEITDRRAKARRLQARRLRAGVTLATASTGEAEVRSAEGSQRTEFQDRG